MAGIRGETRPVEVIFGNFIVPEKEQQLLELKRRFVLPVLEFIEKSLKNIKCGYEILRDIKDYF